MGHNLSTQIREGASDAFNGTVNTISDTLNGVEGHGFNYDDVARDWRNVGVAYHNATAGYSKQQLYSAPQSEAERLSNLLNPNTSVNRSLWAQTSSASLHASYGPQAGTAGITPPSQLSAISDPATKTLIARSRGPVRDAVNASAKTSDATVAPALQQGAQPTASAMINSAGGTGIATASEQNSAMNGTMKSLV
jgi:hypothetical protein